MGNLRGLYPAAAEKAARLVIASHLDTVPHGGAFDGVLGVMMGVALLKSLAGKRLAVEIEVIGFSEEEGVRYGIPFIGSRAVMGTIDDGLARRIEPAIRDFGLDPAALPAAAWRQQIAGYLEFHIEQGPVLESLDLPLGVVAAIVGQTRGVVSFRAGQPCGNHRWTCGATLAAAAGIARSKIAAEIPGSRHGRSLSVEPGAWNVIAGMLPQRHSSCGEWRPPRRRRSGIHCYFELPPGAVCRALPAR